MTAPSEDAQRIGALYLAYAEIVRILGTLDDEGQTIVVEWLVARPDHARKGERS